jgi:hypothetical protein
LRIDAFHPLLVLVLLVMLVLLVLVLLLVMLLLELDRRGCSCSLHGCLNCNNESRFKHLRR